MSADESFETSQPTGTRSPRANEQTPRGSVQTATSERDPGDKVKVPADGDAEGSDQLAKSNKLTPEEQMALYEKALKEDDWGHQPC